MKTKISLLKSAIQECANDNNKSQVMYALQELDEVIGQFRIFGRDSLGDFWNRTSDACPLECTAHEKEIEDWEDWINEQIPL